MRLLQKGVNDVTNKQNYVMVSLIYSLTFVW